MDGEKKVLKKRNNLGITVKKRQTWQYYNLGTRVPGTEAHCVFVY
jgi:hypothetical protein